MIRNKFARGERPIFKLPTNASPEERATPPERYAAWNREMWSGYVPKRTLLCRRVADWAVLFKSKREEIEAQTTR